MSRPSNLKKKNINADVVISSACALHEPDFAQNFLMQELKKADLRVWCAKDEKEADSTSAQAILQCKVFLAVLTEECVQMASFKDELSLAYISNKTIIPVSRKYFKQIDAVMDSGMKLMMAKINWTFFVKDHLFEESIDNLAAVLLQEVSSQYALAAEKQQEGAGRGEDEEFDIFEALNNHAPDIEPLNSEQFLDKEGTTCEHLVESINCDFWERHFQGKGSVTWVEFREKFLTDYGERIKRQLGEEKDNWITTIMYQDILELRKVISKKDYMHFCGHNKMADPDYFFERVKDYVIGISAMRMVFNMDSTVRLTAIQNLGTFHTPAVITMLFDLIQDKDANIRAVAALALAKTGKKTRKMNDQLIKMLGDEDRVVRESACLSLAYMRCMQAIPSILDLWRNDAIKHVREAAQLALSRIGGKEAEQAIKVTSVLSEEMNALREAGKTPNTPRA